MAFHFEDYPIFASPDDPLTRDRVAAYLDHISTILGREIRDTNATLARLTAEGCGSGCKSASRIFRRECPNVRAISRMLIPSR